MKIQKSVKSWIAAFMLIIFMSSYTGLLYAYGLADPAALYCLQHGGVHAVSAEYETSKPGKPGYGGEVGLCIFQDGSYCDEWAYFKGKCQGGQQWFPWEKDGKFNEAHQKNYCFKRMSDKQGMHKLMFCQHVDTDKSECFDCRE